MVDVTTNNITRRCVSLANGDLSPDLRVNYEFGLVLGVDEFRQEQLYFLSKEYLHNRSLHGYGTVSGLDVTLQDQDNDIQITVAPGIGIDQFGRTFIIRHEQCALLGAWLAKQQTTPGVIVPIGEGGEIVVYLVGAYDECLDALVRIAGQPCSSSDQTTAASRIRDSFNLTLRFQPPAMPAWDAVRRFALVMARVEVDPTLPPDQSEEADLLEVVRVLDQPDEFRLLNLRLPGEEPPTGAPRTYRIPAEGANAVLDRVFTVWATEVRPNLAPDLIEPNATGDAESGVLLATIRFRLDADSTPENPILHGVTEELTDSVSDEGRPFLLHTQLIQELLLLRTGTAGKPEREFATLHVSDFNTVIVWVHHGAAVTLPMNLGDELQLLVNGTPYTGSVAPAAGSQNVFLITTEERIPAEARVELRFNLNAVLVAEETEGEAPVNIPLIERIDTLGFAYIGRDGDFLVVYTFAENLPDVRDFVSFDTVVAGEEAPRIRLWFHAPPPFLFDEGNVRLRIHHIGAAEEDVAVQLQPEGGPDSPVWTAAVDAELENGALLTFQFDTDKIRANAPTLTAMMREEQFSYLGYDGETTLTAHYIVDLPPSVVVPPDEGGLTEEQVLELIGRVQTRPFVTITPFLRPFEQSGEGLDILVCELWFHLDEEPHLYEAEVQELNFQILAEIGDDLLELQKDVDQRKRNVFVTAIQSPDVGFIPGQYTYMRFLFPVDEIFVQTANFGGSLREYIQKYHVKFHGAYGTQGKHLVAYVRTPANVEG
jgi:hypothetical protein